jgi:hypothetical protein
MRVRNECYLRDIGGGSWLRGGFGAGLWSNLVYESQPDGGDEGGGVEFHSDCCYGEFWGDF